VQELQGFSHTTLHKCKTFVWRLLQENKADANKTCTYASIQGHIQYLRANRIFTYPTV